MTTASSSVPRALTNTLVAVCPYCSCRFPINAPGSEVGIKLGMELVDFECLPYTRDIERFDPEPGQSKVKWSTVGRDYYKPLDWERIGILRLRLIQGQIIRYCVARCPAPDCCSLFDVFTNYTSLRPLHYLWPHLFSRVNPTSDDILPYEYRPWIVKLADDKLALIGSVILFYILSFMPIIINEWSILQRPRGLDTFVATYKSHLLLRLIGSIILVLMLLLRNKYIELFRCGKFDKLLNIRQPRGVNYWRNYTLCRFTGVRFKNQWFSPNPIMVIGGVPTVILMLICWIINLSSKNNAELIVELTIAISIGAIIGLLFFLFARRVTTRTQTKATSSGNMSWLSRLSQITTIISSHLTVVFGAIGGFLAWFAVQFQQILVSIQSTLVVDLSTMFFWLVFSYFAGVYLSISETPVRILRGLQCIPMKLNPLTNFAELEPLEQIGTLSIFGIIVLEIFFILLSTFHIFYTTQSQLIWLLNWFQWSLAFLYLALSLPLRKERRWHLRVLAIIFLMLQFLLGTPQSPGWAPSHSEFLMQNVLNQHRLYEYLYLVVIGIFASYISYIQSLEIFDIIKDIKDRHKLFQTELYKRILIKLQTNVQYEVQENQTIDQDKAKQIQNFTDTSNSILSLHDRVVNLKTAPLFYQRIIAVISPLVTAIAVPILVRYLSKK